MEKIAAAEASSAGVVSRPSVEAMVGAKGVYRLECVDKDGNVRWSEEIENLVTTVGKNDLLDKYLAGSAYTASPAIGLMGGGATPAAGDTMASHAGWTEVGGVNLPTYSGNRKSPSWSAASAGSKTMSAVAAFAITGTGNVAGMFIVMNGSTTKDDTTGVLFSVGAFTTGTRAVLNGDTVNVSYTLSIT